jgi:hypothetical protein
MIGTVKGVRAYLNKAIASFDGDPPDTAFQKGYLAALEDARNEMFGEPSRHPRKPASRRKAQ